MKRVVRTGLVIGLSIGLWQVSADARFLDLEQKELAPVPTPEIAPTPQSVAPNPTYKSAVEPQGISLQFERVQALLKYGCECL